MAHRGADTVSASVTTANHHYVLALSGDEIAVLVPIEEAASVVGEEIHGKMDAFEVAAFDGQVARLGCARAEDGGVEFVQKLFGREIHTDFGVGHKSDALGFH